MQLPITADVISSDGEPAIPEGATAPPLRIQFRDADGEPVDLGGAARTQLKLRPDSGAILERRADVTDPDQGIVEYRWQAEDTATPGLLRLRVSVETRTGDVYVLPTGDPVTLSIRAEL